MLEIQSKNCKIMCIDKRCCNIWNDHRSFADNRCTIISRKEAHPPFVNEIIAKGAFLSKVRPPIDAAVNVVMLSKKHWRNSTVLLLHKQVHNKRALQNHCMHTCNLARLTECEVGIFSRWAYFEETLAWKHVHPLWSHLIKFIAHQAYFQVIVHVWHIFL